MSRSALAILVGLAVVALAACSGSSSGNIGDTATSTPPPTRSTNPNVAPGLGDPTASSGEARQGGTLNIQYADPPTLDPALVTDTTSAGLIVEIFSGLVTLDENMIIVPDLADSWSTSGGGTVYEFRLRDDLKFSDGTPVTAADFKWSMERAAHPDTGSFNAETYLGDVVGINEIINGRGEVTEASGIEVVDASTLKITIDAPKAYFLAKLTYPTAFVVKQENVEAGGRSWTDTPVGTGPFFLREYRIGQRIVLERNENYWGRDAYVDRVVMNLAGGVAMAMYENDEIDITGVGLADRDRVQDPTEPLNADLVSVPPQFSISYIGFNVNQAPFDDLNFRQALTHAVNKQLIADEVYSGFREPANNILPPRFPGYTDDIDGLGFNLELAQQLLAESAYADPASRPSIIVTIPGTGGSPSLDVEVIQDMWRNNLGVEIEIRQVEWATYLQDLNRGRLQAWAGLGWSADYADPQDFIDILFASDSANNHGHYANEQVDDLVMQARTEQDESRRFELYNEAEQLIVQDAPWVPLWFDSEGLALIKPWVKGYKFVPIIVPRFKDVWIDR
jgi:oligopeptide transport system substrate-binding protein